MLPVSASPVLLVIAGARTVECALVRGRGAAAAWTVDSVRQARLDSTDPASLIHALATLALPEGGATLRVVVADCWLGAQTLPWSDALLTADGTRAAAAACLAQSGDGGALRAVVRTDSAAFGQPRLALAYPAALMDALQALAVRAAAPLASVLAMSAAAWQLARQDGAPVALAVVHEGMVIVVRGAGALQEATMRTGTSGTTVDAIWRRLCLREPRLAALDAVPVLDVDSDRAAAPLAPPFVPLALAEHAQASLVLQLAANLPPGALPLDAVARTPAPSLLRSVGAGLALVLAVGACLLATRAIQAGHAARAALAARAPVVTRALPVPAWTAAELVRVHAANRAIGQLNVPLPAVLAALRPPPDLRIAVLGVSTSADGGAARGQMLKISAVAATRSDMARYVAYVAERRPFVRTYLTEHDIDETSAQRPYKFVMEATWDD